MITASKWGVTFLYYFFPAFCTMRPRKSPAGLRKERLRRLNYMRFRRANARLDFLHCLLFLFSFPSHSSMTDSVSSGNKVLSCEYTTNDQAKGSAKIMPECASVRSSTAMWFFRSFLSPAFRSLSGTHLQQAIDMVLLLPISRLIIRSSETFCEEPLPLYTARAVTKAPGVLE
uniref:Putative secreted protein n=1 Tax=Ixodes ricinus TaxID=34613 RepID=A0A6B0UZG8_IXORI